MTETQDTTSSSLLERVKTHDADAWQRLSELYGPLVYSWARQSGLQATDAADVVQEVFQVLSEHIAGFHNDGAGDSFRGWLWTITRNRIRDHFRSRASKPEAVGGTDAQRRFAELADTPPSEQSSSHSTDRTALFERALALIRTDFEETTWRAFLRTVVDGEKPAAVAEELGVSVWTVYKAKSRVLGRLRDELRDLVDF